MSQQIDTDKTTTKSQHTIRLFVLTGIAIAIVLATVSYISHHNNPERTVDNKQASSVKAHKPGDAVDSVNLLYTDYLPQKQQVFAEVGNNPNVEPAAVQVLRANEVYFTPAFYKAALDTYMKEFQASGTVNQDAVACVNTVTSSYTTKLASSTKNSATVNVGIVLQDGSQKEIPVTVDLQTLKISAVNCAN